MKKSNFDPVPVLVSYIGCAEKTDQNQKLSQVIGVQCKRFRTNYGWTRKVFADAIGVHTNILERFENGGYFNLYVFSCYLSHMVELFDIRYLSEQLNMERDYENKR